MQGVWTIRSGAMLPGQASKFGRANATAGHSRQFFSSLMSPQSLSLSHCQMLFMQFPLKHLYWFGRHVFSGTKGKTKTSWHEQDAVPSEDRLYSSTPKGQQKGHADLSQW